MVYTTKYEVKINVEVKVDGETKYVLEGGNTYAATMMKQTGWGTYSEDGGKTTVPVIGHPDIKKRSIIANITDEIIALIIKEKRRLK